MRYCPQEKTTVVARELHPRFRTAGTARLCGYPAPSLLCPASATLYNCTELYGCHRVITASGLGCTESLLPVMNRLLSTLAAARDMTRPQRILR
jgi:hypothetical protein